MGERRMYKMCLKSFPLYAFICLSLTLLRADAQANTASCFQKVVSENFFQCLGTQAVKDSVGSWASEFFHTEEKHEKDCGSVTTKCITKIMKKFSECYSGANQQEESRFNVMEGAINAGTTYLCKDNGKANEAIQQDEKCKTGKFSCMSSLLFSPPSFDAEGCKKLRNHFADCKTKSECQGNSANTYEEYLNIIMDSTPCKILTTTVAPTPFLNKLFGSSSGQKIVGTTAMLLLSSLVAAGLNQGRYAE